MSNRDSKNVNNDARIFDDLIAKLYLAESGKKEETVSRIAELFNVRHTNKLIEELYSDDPYKVADIGLILTAIGKPIAKHLAPVLGNGNQLATGVVIRILIQFGKSSVMPVLEAMKNAGPKAIDDCTKVIKSIGKPAVSELIKANNPQSKYYSSHVMEILFELDPDAALESYKYLVDDLDSEDPIILGICHVLFGKQRCACSRHSGQFNGKHRPIYTADCIQCPALNWGGSHPCPDICTGINQSGATAKRL